MELQDLQSDTLLSSTFQILFLLFITSDPYDFPWFPYMIYHGFPYFHVMSLVISGVHLIFREKAVLKTAEANLAHAQAAAEAVMGFMGEFKGFMLRQLWLINGITIW